MNELGTELPLVVVVPFVGILLSIAIFPLIAPRFWHDHFPKISAFWALIFAVPFIIRFGDRAIHEILHIYLADYIPFIILLWTLYTISGGILVKGRWKVTPALNTAILFVGTCLASWIGTTGASMLLIRPLLRANEGKRFNTHIVIFFIFLVSNIGGAITPLGDPPLFLGFLHGVPFFWTFSLLPTTLLITVTLLILFFIMDSYYVKKTSTVVSATLTHVQSIERPDIRLEGLFNLIFLAGVIIAVLISGIIDIGKVDIFGIHIPIQNLVRDAIMLVMGGLSLYFTNDATRKELGFTWGPIREVAYLFAGIFMTIIPALAILKAGDKGALKSLLLSIKEPSHYFWATGILSSFLDNAPTYLTLFNTALGRLFPGIAEQDAVCALIAQKPLYLAAISAGAVFMGANTYIGNAPNLMVKSIAEEMGIKMPSFLGYMLKYSIPILIPIFIIVTYIFY